MAPLLLHDSRASDRYPSTENEKARVLPRNMNVATWLVLNFYDFSLAVPRSPGERRCTAKVKLGYTFVRISENFGAEQEGTE